MVQFYKSLTIAGLILAFGLYSGPVYWLLYKLTPFYKRFKFPSRHLIIVNFALCVLAGYGYDKYPNPWFLLITIIELFWFGKKFLYLRNESDFYPPQEVMDYLKAFPPSGQGTILTLSVFRDGVDWEPGVLEFPANATIPLKIVNITGYDPFILHNYHRLLNRLQGLPEYEYGQVTVKIEKITEGMMDLLHIEYIFVGDNYADYGINLEDFHIPVRTKKGMLLARILR